MNFLRIVFPYFSLLAVKNCYFWPQIRILHEICFLEPVGNDWIPESRPKNDQTYLFDKFFGSHIMGLFLFLCYTPRCFFDLLIFVFRFVFTLVFFLVVFWYWGSYAFQYSSQGYFSYSLNQHQWIARMYQIHESKQGIGSINGKTITF